MKQTRMMMVSQQQQQEQQQREEVGEASVVDRVWELYEKISKLESLKPCEQVNTLFTELVNTCMPSYPNLDVPGLPDPVQEMRSRLIRLCGEAEGLLEAHYSAILGSFHSPLRHLSLFPYFSNYLKLAHLEFTILTSTHSSTIRNVAFIGSGPLPLTSLVLATHHLPAASFHNYDVDPAANAMASRLVQSDPAMASRMVFRTANILDVCEGELEGFEVVFLAALVGMDMEEKRKVIQHLARHMAPGATLMLRSAHGARAFLYPVVHPADLPGFEVLSVHHPTDEVINSVLVARKLIPAPSSIAPNLILSNKCCCEQMRGYNRNLDQELAAIAIAMEDHII